MKTNSYLLDTNVMIAFFRSSNALPKKVIQIIEKYGAYISSASIYELYFIAVSKFIYSAHP